MSLVHGMLAGADSIDDMDVLRAGSTGLILGHRVMAPSTLGTFLRAFTFGHVRQLDRVLDVALARAWAAGAGAGRRAVGGRHRQLHRRGLRRAEAGRRLRVHAEAWVSPDPRGPRGYRRGAAHPQPQRQGEHAARRCSRFVDELLARVRRAGHTGPIMIRADSGFENHKVIETLDTRGHRVLDRRQAVKDDPGADRRDPRGATGSRSTTTRTPARRRLAETTLGELAADRAPHPAASARKPNCSPTGATTRSRPTAPIPMLRRRHRSSRPRHDRARDPRSQRPSTRALPLRPVRRQQRLDRDRRAGAQPRPLEHPDRSAHPARPNRPNPPPPALADPRPPDPYQPPMDPPDARPLALAEPVQHRPGHDPRAPCPHLTPPRQTRRPADHPRHTPRSPLPENVTQTLPRERRHPTTPPNPTQSPRNPPKPTKPAQATRSAQPLGGFRMSRLPAIGCEGVLGGW